MVFILVLWMKSIIYVYFFIEECYWYESEVIVCDVYLFVV